MLAMTCVLGLSWGCNRSERGANDLIRFTPDDCGRPDGCDFGDTVGVGGVIAVRINGIGGHPTAGIDLVSEDPDIFDASPTGNIAGSPAWEIFGAAPGVARLIAVDTDDVEVDWIDVVVRSVDSLTTINTLGDAVGPDLTDPDFDEVWAVNADTSVVFWVQPVAADGTRLMGRYVYSATFDAGILDNLDSTDVSSGRLSWSVPPGSGDYQASFDNGQDNAIDVLFEAL